MEQYKHDPAPHFPLVSVIMTVYNGESHLAQAIDSVRQQSMLDFELLIIDDGSDDLTPQILSEAQKDEPRIQVISRPRLGVRPILLNLAIANARGKYIAILDADDMAEPYRLEKQVAFLEKHPDVGLLGTTCKFLNETTGRETVRRSPLTDSELRKSFLRGNPIVHSSIMAPRQVINAIGGYNEAFRLSEDYELYIRIATLYQIAILPDILTIKRFHQQAHFQALNFPWEKCKAEIKIRWHAWRQLARPIIELPLVVSPITKYLYVQFASRVRARQGRFDE